jgi:hypothetical protein
VSAQNEEPYSKISIEMNYLQNKPSKFLDKYWKSDYGLQGFLSTPFYYGKILAGINYYSFTSRDEKYPGFKGFFINAGWGNEIKLPLNLIFCSSVKAGSLLMYFKVDSLSAFERFESEFAVSLNTTLKYKLNSCLRINLGGEFTTVFLHNKMKLLTAFAGLEFSFASPTWIKEFFE